MPSQGIYCSATPSEWVEEGVSFRALGATVSCSAGGVYLTRGSEIEERAILGNFRHPVVVRMRSTRRIEGEEERSRRRTRATSKTRARATQRT